MRIAFLLVVAGVFGVQADATAIASVKESTWQADFAYYFDPLTETQSASLPAGVMLSCVGTAHSDGVGGCTDKRSASVTSSNGALVTQTIDALGGLQLHNASVTSYGGSFVFTTKYSSFNPGGPDIGIRVDDPATEYAAFFTVVSGPGAFDLHGCDLQHRGGPPGGGGGPGTCGVAAPGFNWGQATLGPLAAGAMTAADYQIYINVAAQGADPVPEPPTVLVLSLALVLLAFTGRGPRAA
jgi:hypothetical protein